MVVNIKRCIEEKIAIWCTTKEQSQQIWDDFHEYKNIKTRHKWKIESTEGYEVYFLPKENSPSWQDNYNKRYFIDKHGANKCLDYNEVLLNKIIELW